MQDRTEERFSAGEQWPVEPGCHEAASPLYAKEVDVLQFQFRTLSVSGGEVSLIC